MMDKYHKIQTIFKRDEKKKLIEGEWTKEEFEYLAGNHWFMDEKIDGTNIRVIWLPEQDRIVFEGRKERSSTPMTLVNALLNSFNKEKFREVFGDTPACLYGEGYGKGIQGKYGLAYHNYNLINSDFECGFVLFDVKVGRWWFTRDNVAEIAKTFGIPMVPSYGMGNLHEAIRKCKQGFLSLFANGEIEAEGFVLRPIYELKTRSGERMITKLKIKDF